MSTVVLCCLRYSECASTPLYFTLQSCFNAGSKLYKFMPFSFWCSCASKKTFMKNLVEIWFSNDNHCLEHVFLKIQIFLYINLEPYCVWFMWFPAYMYKLFHSYQILTLYTFISRPCGLDIQNNIMPIFQTKDAFNMQLIIPHSSHMLHVQHNQTLSNFSN